MAGMTVGGLASGLDTNSIITGLISIEQQRVTREADKQQDYQLKLTTFNDLKTKLDDFYNKSKDLNKLTAFDLFKGTSSDDTVATITGEAGATAGNFDLKVSNLASTTKVASKSFASSITAQNFTGSFTISTSAAALKADPTTTDVTVDISATDSLKDIAAKINRAKGGGATASIIQMGTGDYRLMLTAVDEGTKAFNLNTVAGREAKGLFSDGLDLVSEATATTAKQSLRTDFDLRLATGGAAASTTTFSQIFNSLGSTTGLTAGDQITITGTDAANGAVASSFTIANPAVDTVQGLLTQIQTAFGGVANADVTLNSSGEIVVTDKTNGGTPMVLNLSLNDVDSSGSQLGLGTSKTRTAFKNVISEGKKAFYLLNDISVSSQTNKDNGTIAGTVFQLKRADPATSVKLQLAYDKDAIKKKVQDFLDGYNLVAKFLDDKSKITVANSKDPNQDPTKALQSGGKNAITKGPFAGDSSILSLKSQMQSLLTNKISELGDQGLSKYSSLASLGITSDRKSGLLTINDDTFNTAIDSDFEGVKRLFVTNGYASNPAHTFGTYSKDTQTGVYSIKPATSEFDTDKTTGTTYAVGTVSGDGDVLNSNSGDSKGMAVKAAAASGVGTITFIRGIAGQIQDYYEKITNFTDGFVSNETKTIQKYIDDQKTKIDTIQKQVDGHKSRLTQQFANLELAISKLQSQSAAFGGQVSSLKR
jgi:flagellar hook-associated protein 2